MQEAYDQIMKQRENGGYSGGYAGNYSGGYSSGQSYSSGSEDDAKMQAACNYINARHYREALNVLSSMSNQNARWYYCSAIANYGVGNNLVAMEHAQRAASMEPGNPEYTNLVNQFQWRGQRYQNTGYGYGRPTFGTGNMCCDLWCADQMCECMGGDLCSCM